MREPHLRTSAGKRVGFVEQQQWRSVNVRRPSLSGVQSVDLCPRWAVFEPNGDGL